MGPKNWAYAGQEEFMGSNLCVPFATSLHKEEDVRVEGGVWREEVIPIGVDHSHLATVLVSEE